MSPSERDWERFGWTALFSAVILWGFVVGFCLMAIADYFIR